MFSPIPEILDELRAGRMIVLVDDEDRENEGDLVIPAEKTTTEIVNFMRLHTGGVICVSVEDRRADMLKLPPMTLKNTSFRETAFTVSVDAREGITTGISAADRAQTIRVIGDPECTAKDLVQPGHVFPLRAKEGGVLQRAGHTEGAVDLCRLIGAMPAGVISEVMNEDGSPARVPQLETFCEKHGLKMTTIAALVEYRRRTERQIEKQAEVRLPTDFGEFQVHCYHSLIDDYLHLAVATGEAGKSKKIDRPVLVRVHSECFTGDVFHSLRCDCREQLHAALKSIAKAGEGVVLYMRQEGRGIGLVEKLKAYALQDQGLDTVQANEELGHPADLREYGVGAQILYDLGVRQMRLMTNNPKKIHSIQGYGLEVVEQVPIEVEPTEHNRKYLETKKLKMGHTLRQVDEEGA